MGDPLSVTSGAFAAVGFVDVLVRASIECCRFLSAIAHAPVEIERLKCCIKENKTLLEEVKNYLKDQTWTDCMDHPDNKFSKLLEATLHGLEREFDEIQKLGKRYQDGKWARIKFVLDERRIARHIQRFESTKVSLSNALSVSHSWQSSKAYSETRSMLQQGLQQGNIHFNEQKKAMQSIQGDLKSLRHSHDREATRQRQRMDILKKQISRTKRIAEKERRETISMLDKTHRLSWKYLVSRADDLQASMSTLLGTARTKTREIHFIGEQRKTLLLPLLLMKERLRTAIPDILTHDSERVSACHLVWVERELESLVSSAVQEATGSVTQGSTATTLDVWKYSRGPHSLQSAYDDTAPTQLLWEKEFQTQTMQQRFPRHMVFHRSTDHGEKLQIVVPRIQKSQTPPMFSEVLLSFAPSPNICETAITIRFLRFLEPERVECKLYTQINAFCMVESGEFGRYHRYIVMCTIQELDAAIRGGKISPYGIDNARGNLCIYMAAHYGRVDVLEYFESQGIGLAQLNGYDSALGGFDSGITHVGKDEQDSHLKMLSFLETSVTTCSAFTVSSLLDVHDGKLALIRRFFRFLASEGYDWEQRDIFGQTALLYFLKGGGSVKVLTCLMEEAHPDVHATDIFGWSPLICAFDRYKSWGESPCSRSWLQHTLRILINAGADVNHRDYWGRSPSYWAVHLTPGTAGHRIWLEALEQDNLKVDEDVRPTYYSGNRSHNSKKRRRRQLDYRY
ncbi:hypothetical protein BCR34DRAFT_569282 [Clohesyomyces aquaticus]|uniref:Uncharacterized protein n=1 Tax=Clohesyomyces aquaticus TaxID=1231657 RepID=A0A1Y1ZF81_9PLEO|nr:hypothetical protein BCR34DRAFT_569282 [Clohesyomyces aquaticus]